MNTTSPSLLLRLRDPGAQEDWSRFVRLYAPLIESWVRPFDLSQQESEDLVQEVFTNLVRELPRFEYDPTKSFRAWLCTVSRNTVRTQLRARQPRIVTNSEEWLNGHSAPEAYEISAKEFREYVTNRALLVMRQDFEPTTWQAFWQTVSEGRSGTEVAKTLGLSVNAVYVAKYRVLRRLREELAGMVDED